MKEEITEELIIKRKEEALKRVQEDYFNPNSKHCNDHERFRWAVETINSRSADDLARFKLYSCT